MPSTTTRRSRRCATAWSPLLELRAVSERAGLPREVIDGFEKTAILHALKGKDDDIDALSLLRMARAAERLNVPLEPWSREAIWEHIFRELKLRRKRATESEAKAPTKNAVFGELDLAAVSHREVRELARSMGVRTDLRHWDKRTKARMITEIAAAQRRQRERNNNQPPTCQAPLRATSQATDTTVDIGKISSAYTRKLAKVLGSSWAAGGKERAAAELTCHIVKQLGGQSSAVAGTDSQVDLAAVPAAALTKIAGALNIPSWRGVSLPADVAAALRGAGIRPEIPTLLQECMPKKPEDPLDAAISLRNLRELAKLHHVRSDVGGRDRRTKRDILTDINLVRSAGSVLNQQHETIPPADLELELFQDILDVFAPAVLLESKGKDELLLEIVEHMNTQAVRDLMSSWADPADRDLIVKMAEWCNIEFAARRWAVDDIECMEAARAHGVHPNLSPDDHCFKLLDFFLRDKQRKAISNPSAVLQGPR